MVNWNWIENIIVLFVMDRKRNHMWYSSYCKKKTEYLNFYSNDLYSFALRHSKPLITYLSFFNTSATYYIMIKTFPHFDFITINPKYELFNKIYLKFWRKIKKLQGSISNNNYDNLNVFLEFLLLYHINYFAGY